MKFVKPEAEEMPPGMQLMELKIRELEAEVRTLHSAPERAEAPPGLEDENLLEFSEGDMEQLRPSRQVWLTQLGQRFQPVAAGPIVEDDRPACEACGRPAEWSDIEGVPICRDCWTEMGWSIPSRPNLAVHQV